MRSFGNACRRQRDDAAVKVMLAAIGPYLDEMLTEYLADVMPDVLAEAELANVRKATMDQVEAYLRQNAGLLPVDPALARALAPQLARHARAALNEARRPPGGDRRSRFN